MNRTAHAAPPTVGDVADTLNTAAPLASALEEDNVGLLVGDPETVVTQVLVCTTVTLSVIENAIAAGVNLIVSHEPVIAEPLDTITAGDPVGDRVTALIRNEIACLALHSNAQAVTGGLDDTGALALGIAPLFPLYPLPKALYKLTVFVPVDHQESVRKAVCAAGAGGIGNYTECTFRTEGTGTFTPQAGADPFIGSAEQFEEVAEERLEMLVPEDRLEAVTFALLEAHPYEEPAYDIYSLLDATLSEGLGRGGMVAGEPSFTTFVATVKEAFGVSQVSWIGSEPARVTTAAYVTGNGSAVAYELLSDRFDVIVAGSIDTADGIALCEAGSAVVLIGNHPSQRPFVPLVAHALSEQLPALTVISDDTDPAPSISL